MWVLGVGEDSSFDDCDGAGGAVMAETVAFVSMVILEEMTMVLEVLLVTVVLVTVQTKDM